MELRSRWKGKRQREWAKNKNNSDVNDKQLNAQDIENIEKKWEKWLKFLGVRSREVKDPRKKKSANIETDSHIKIIMIANNFYLPISHTHTCPDNTQLQ